MGDPQLSPDGRRVAFVVTTLSTEEDAYLSNIWVVQTAPGAPARVELRGPPRVEGAASDPGGVQLRQRATRKG